jgi:hypothetical protein
MRAGRWQSPSHCAWATAALFSFSSNEELTQNLATDFHG